MQLPHWSAGRVTLVGDACQAVSLLAGQGASLAVAGAFLLVDYLGGLPDSQLQLGLRRAALKLARLPGIDRYIAGAVLGKPQNMKRDG